MNPFLRILPMVAALWVAIGVVFLPWVDSGSGDVARAVRDKPGFENADEALAIAPHRGWETTLGPFVAGAAVLAWIVTFAADRLARRGNAVRARQAVSAAFALFLVAAILTLTTLLRGPGAPMPTTLGIYMIPRFAAGLWVTLAGAAVGTAVCGGLLAKPPRERGRARG